MDSTNAARTVDASNAAAGFSAPILPTVYSTSALRIVDSTDAARSLGSQFAHSTASTVAGHIDDVREAAGSRAFGSTTDLPPISAARGRATMRSTSRTSRFSPMNGRKQLMTQRATCQSATLRRQCASSQLGSANSSPNAAQSSPSNAQEPCVATAQQPVVYKGQSNANFTLLSSATYRDTLSIDTIQPKLLPPTSNCKEIGEFFDIIFDAEIINKIVDSTNKRLTELKIKHTDPIELRCFLGVLLHLGYVKKNDVEVERIWSAIDSQHSDFALTRNRFQEISVNIRFDDIHTRLERCFQSKLYKIDEIFNLFRKNIKRALDPGSNLCVDETLYSYRGRCPFKQYIPSKPAKYGIKLWSIVDNQTKYLLDALVYQGKEINTTATAQHATNRSRVRIFCTNKEKMYSKCNAFLKLNKITIFCVV